MIRYLCRIVSLMCFIFLFTSCTGSISTASSMEPADSSSILNLNEQTVSQNKLSSLNEFVRSTPIEIEGQYFADDYLILRNQLLQKLEKVSEISLTIDDITKVDVEHDTWGWPNTSAYIFKVDFHDDAIEYPYFICMQKTDRYSFYYEIADRYSFYHLDRCTGLYSDTYIADLDSDGFDEVLSSFIDNDGKMTFHIAKWSKDGLDTLACTDKIEPLKFEAFFQNDFQTVIRDTTTGYEETFHAVDDLKAPIEYDGTNGKIISGSYYTIDKGIDKIRFKIIDLGYDKQKDLMIYQPFCITASDGSDKTIGYAYQALQYRADTNTFDIEKSKFIPVSSSPLDFAEERVFGYSPDRQFYRYYIENAQWNENEQSFPAQWISNAKESILQDVKHIIAGEMVSQKFELAYEEITFTRGWLHDFDCDGNSEAILLLRAIKDESRIPWEGDSHFVYVNSAGQAQYLTVGCDISENIQGEIWRKMDAWLIRYQGFDHIHIRTGNDTMTSGCIDTIHRAKNGVLEHLLTPYWLATSENSVFFESGGPQGKGPAYHFWDEFNDCYGTIGPVEVPLETFMKDFDPAKIVWNKQQIDDEDDKRAMRMEYTYESIEKIEVYGNRYYHIHLKEMYSSDFASVVTWLLAQDGKWELFYGPTGGNIGSLTYGGSYDDFYVYDIDMSVAELLDVS